MRRKYRPTPPQERLKEVFNYDPETGIFTRRIDRRKWKAGQVVGTLADGYININIDQIIYRAHRLAWVYMTGEEPPTGIDHIDGNPLNNKFSNLRLADQTHNMCNARTRLSSRSGLKGVSPNRRGTFTARVNYKKKCYNLGDFKTPEEAKAAYDSAAKILHGEFFKS